MHQLSKLPNVLFPNILVFLTTSDTMQLEQTSIEFYKHCQHWLGDAQSHRIRPLQLRASDSNGREDSNASLPPLLHQVYLPDLVLWSLAFRATLKTRHEDRKNTGRRQKRGVGLIDDMKINVPRDVVNSLFTSKEFRHKTISQSPMNEGAWKTSINQVTDQFYFFFDFMYILGRNHADVFQYFTAGVKTFDAWSDRQKLLFFDKVSVPVQQTPSVDSFVQLSSRALSLIMTSRAKTTLKFMKYVLWTVWGPTLHDTHHPILNPAHMPPTGVIVRPDQLVYVNEAVQQALPYSFVPDASTTSMQTLKNMFHLREMQSTRWYSDSSFQFYVDIISGESDILITFHVFRKDHVTSGFALYQQLVMYRDRVEVVYSVLNTMTNQHDKLFVAKYDPSIPSIQEPPEVMCWKYIPIHTVQCQFTAYLHPSIQKRTFQNVMNPKILAKQQDSIVRWFDEWFWKVFGIRAPVSSPCITPRFSVVNCCVWDVFYSIVQ